MPEEADLIVSVNKQTFGSAILRLKVNTATVSLSPSHNRGGESFALSSRFKLDL